MLAATLDAQTYDYVCWHSMLYVPRDATAAATVLDFPPPRGAMAVLGAGSDGKQSLQALCLRLADVRYMDGWPNDRAMAPTALSLAAATRLADADFVMDTFRATTTMAAAGTGAGEAGGAGGAGGLGRAAAAATAGATATGPRVEPYTCVNPGTCEALSKAVDEAAHRHTQRGSVSEEEEEEEEGGAVSDRGGVATVGYDLLEKSTRTIGSTDTPLTHLVVQAMPGHSQGVQDKTGKGEARA